MAALEKPKRGFRSREKTRQKLIEAALRVMSVKGVDGTAIADITEEADVGFGSFYNHFATKRDIARAAFNAHAQRLKTIFRQIADNEPDRAVAVTYIFQVFLTKAISDPIWGSFVVHAAADLPGMWLEVFEEFGAQHLREGLAGGRFTFSSEKSAMRLIIAAIIATMRVLIEKTAEPSAGENTVESLLRTLGVDADEAFELSRRPLPAYVSQMLSGEGLR